MTTSTGIRPHPRSRAARRSRTPTTCTATNRMRTTTPPTTTSPRGPRLTVAGLAAFSGGLLASGAVVAVLLTPPASLSAELAVSRDVGAPPVRRLRRRDPRRVGRHLAVRHRRLVGGLRARHQPETFDGKPVTLTGFITPGQDGATFDLTRLVITHCVIDAQTARLPITAAGIRPVDGAVGDVTGTVRSTGDGALEVRADQVAAIDEPADPYEY